MTWRECEVRAWDGGGDGGGGDRRRGKRGLFARRELLPGEIVCSSEASAFVVFNDVAAERCHVCLRASRSKQQPLRRCSSCRYAHYCCEEHQRVAWKRGHREECASLRTQRKEGREQIGATVRLAALLLRQRSGGKTGAENGEHDLIADLHSHPEHYLQHEGEELVCTALAVAAFLRPEGLAPSDRELQRVAPEFKTVCTLLCNAATVCESDQTWMGLGLFPEAAFFNHSCAPNCVQSFETDDATGVVRMVVRTCRGVQRNEQLFITYIDLMQTWRERQEALWRGYAFRCECARCTEDVQDATASRMIQAQERKVGEVESRRKRGDVRGARVLVERLLTAEGEEHYPERILEAKCWYLLANLLVDDSEFGSEAIAACRRSIDALLAAGLPSNSPVVAIQRVMLGKLALYNGDLEQAEASLIHALTILSIMYSDQDDMVLNCEIMLEQAKYEQRSRRGE